MIVCVVKLILNMILFSVLVLMLAVCVVKICRDHLKSLGEITVAVFLWVISVMATLSLLLMIFFSKECGLCRLSG
jgi:hypothetical protein